MLIYVGIYIKKQKRAHESVETIATEKNIRCMSGDGMKVRIKTQQQQIYNLKQINNRLIMRFQETPNLIMMKVNPAFNLQTVLKAAFSEMKENKKFFLQKHLHNCLKISTDGSEKYSEIYVREFSEFLVEEILLKGNTFCEKENNNTHSPALLTLAMKLWSRSNKGFEMLKKSGLIMLPSSSTLYKRQKK